jgi:phosphatidylglycerophosphate synthase
VSKFRDAFAQLTSAQKSARGVSLYSRFVNRPLGRILAAACYTIGLSPNQVSAVSALFTGAGLAVVALVPSVAWKGLLAAALLVLGFAFDSADGQVARLSGKSSPAGEWLDHVIDAGKMVLLHLSVAISWWLHEGVNGWWLAVPFAFQFIHVVGFQGLVAHDLLMRNLGIKTSQLGAVHPVRAIGLLPADYGVIALSFVLIGFPAPFQWVYTILCVLNFIIFGLLLAKWFRSLKRA